MGSQYEINLLRCNCHMRSVFLRFVDQYSMNPYVYPKGFGAPLDAVRAHADVVRALE